MSGRIIKNKGVKKGEVMKASEELLALGEIQGQQQEAQSAKIKGEYITERMEIAPAQVEPAQSLRARILSLSLFPNIYDKNYLMKHY